MALPHRESMAAGFHTRRDARRIFAGQLPAPGGLHRSIVPRSRSSGGTILNFSTTKNAAKTPQINKRNRLPLSALRCHRDRLSTTTLAPFLAVVIFRS